MMPLKLFICAAEPSGDHLASLVLRRLRSVVSVEAMGLAGPLMQKAGVQPIARYQGLTAIGLTEALPIVPRALWTLHTLRRAVLRWRPDVLVTVDAPSLLLRLSRSLPAVPRVHMVAPQVWAWRPTRANRIHHATDRLLCLFPFEPQWFQHADIKTSYIGHPDLGRIQPDKLPSGPPIIALSPGSRPANIHRNIGDFENIAQRVKALAPETEFVVPTAPGVSTSILDRLPGARVAGIKDCRANVALTAPGTATLHWFAKGVPMSVIYRANPVSWHLGRKLVGTIPRVALPNYLAPEARVPEHIQSIDHAAVASEIVSLLGEEGRRQRAQMLRVRPELRGAGASAFAAAEILKAARHQP